MSDNIDFAELDKAIGEAMSHNASEQPKNNKKTNSKNSKSSDVNVAPPKIKKRIKARGHYLDIVDPRSDMHPSSNNPHLPQSSQPTTSFSKNSSTIQDVVRLHSSAEPAKSRPTPNSKHAAIPDPELTQDYDDLSNVTLSEETEFVGEIFTDQELVSSEFSAEDYPEDDFSIEDSPDSDFAQDDLAPIMESEPTTTPAQSPLQHHKPNPKAANKTLADNPELADELEEIEQAIQAVEEQAEAESNFVAQPTAIDDLALKKAHHHAPAPHEPAPNANNYSLGGRSPFMLADAKVDKRPLGKKLPAHHAEAVTSSKNVYSSRTPIKKSDPEQTIKPLVTAPPKKKSGWLRVLAIFLIIFAGAALGLILYFLYPAFFPNN